MTDHVITTTDAQFEEDVIQASAQRLVLVDVWAEWCSPCRALMPVLEKLADELSDQLILAKVNADECQQVTARFGVRSLPTVLLLREGEVIDQFQGALPEKQIREFLAPYVEHEYDRLKASGLEKLAASDMTGLDDLRSAVALAPNNAELLSTLLSALMDACSDQPALLDEVASRLQGATLLLERDPLIQKVRSRYLLLSQAAETSTEDLTALQAAAQQDPSGAAAFEYAQALAVREQYNEALEGMMTILRAPGPDVDATEVKASLVALINTCPDARMANTWRRQLFTLLH